MSCVLHAIADGIRGRKRLLATVGALIVALAAAGATILPRNASAQGSIDVYAGYADSSHGGSSFPNPWAGSPNTIFEGCQPASSCAYDAGAVRVVNNTASTHTFTVVVRMQSCTFDLWPHNVPVASGQQLIVTQTVSGADNGCTANGHMDTSDVGPNGAPWGDHCNQSGVIPQVDVTVDGATTTTFTDSGQILNTGGIDRGACPPGTNESHQWTSLGTATAPAPTMTGRAYGAAATVHVLGIQTAVLAPTPDTGPVSTTAASTTSTPCVVSLTGVVTGGVLCANVTTSTTPPTSTATASVAHATINSGIAGVPVISATAIASKSTTTCAGSSGGSTIASLTIGGQTITLPSTIPANDTIPLLVGTLILNQQVPVPGGLTVNAIHLIVNPLLGTDADVVLASSTSDIHNC